MQSDLKSTSPKAQKTWQEQGSFILKEHLKPRTIIFNSNLQISNVQSTYGNFKGQIDKNRRAFSNWKRV